MIDTVPEILRAPHVPDESGNIRSSYDPVEEAAHHVGRALLALGNPSLAEPVHHDVAQEVAAVRKAELGDLTGTGCAGRGTDSTGSLPRPDR